MKLPFSKPTMAIAAVSAGVAVVSSFQSPSTPDDGAGLQAVVHVPRSSPPSSALQVNSQAAGVTPRGDLSERVALLANRGSESSGGELFNSTALVPPAPPPAPPPKPVAPPFPFSYMGALREDGGVTLFLTNGQRVLAVRADQTIDASYHIDAITDTQLTVTYLPLQQQQIISFGSAR